MARVTAPQEGAAGGGFSFEGKDDNSSVAVSREDGRCPMSAIITLVASAGSQVPHDAFCGSAQDLLDANCFCSEQLALEVREALDVGLLSLFAAVDVVCANSSRIEQCEPLPRPGDDRFVDSETFRFTSMEGNVVTCEVAAEAPSVWCARPPTQIACPVACCGDCGDSEEMYLEGGGIADGPTPAAMLLSPACDDVFAECEDIAEEGGCTEGLSAADAQRMALACPRSCGGCDENSEDADGPAAIAPAPGSHGGLHAPCEDRVDACDWTPVSLASALCSSLQIMRIACPRQCADADAELFPCPSPAAFTDKSSLGDSNGTCPQDLLPSCDAVAATQSCEVEAHFVACPRACGICEPPAPCQDQTEDCATLASTGLCTTQEIKASCPVSCGVGCAGTLPDVEAPAAPQELATEEQGGPPDGAADDCADLDEPACAAAAELGACGRGSYGGAAPVVRQACPVSCKDGCASDVPAATPGEGVQEPLGVCEDPAKVRDCEGACASFDLLGDGTCHQNFACSPLLWDLGDCSEPMAPSGTGGAGVAETGGAP